MWHPTITQWRRVPSAAAGVALHGVYCFEGRIISAEDKAEYYAEIPNVEFSEADSIVLGSDTIYIFACIDLARCELCVVAHTNCADMPQKRDLHINWVRIRPLSANIVSDVRVQFDAIMCGVLLSVNLDYFCG